MALSLNDIKGPRLQQGAKDSSRPKKKPLMPWQRKDEATPTPAGEPEAERNQNEAKSEPEQIPPAPITVNSEPIRSQNKANSKPTTKGPVDARLLAQEFRAKSEPAVKVATTEVDAAQDVHKSEPERSLFEAKSKPLASPQPRKSRRPESEPVQSRIEAESKSSQSQNEANSEPTLGRIGASAFPAADEFGARNRAVSKPDKSQFEAKSEPGTEPKSVPAHDLADLSRLQLRCLEHVYESCRFSGSRVSERLFSGALAETVKSTQSAVKKAMQRLEVGAFIEREAFKKGPGGWTRYRLPETVYRELSIREIRAGTESFQSQNGAKTGPGSEPGTEPNAPSRSSRDINNSNPTTTGLGALAPNSWDLGDIDYSMLADIGFGRSQLVQLRNIGLDRDVIQKSLIYFDYEYRHTERGRSMRDPLAVLMKYMRHQGCWIPPDSYEASKARALTDFQERTRRIEMGAPVGNEAAPSEGEWPQAPFETESEV